MSAGHTATPWVYRKVKTSIGFAYRVGAEEIVNGTHGATVLYDDNTILNPHASGVQEANAEFIVRACNSHDDLVKALKLCAAVCSGETMNKNGLIKALEAARSALAKAGIQS